MVLPHYWWWPSLYAGVKNFWAVHFNCSRDSLGVGGRRLPLFCVVQEYRALNMRPLSFIHVDSFASYVEIFASISNISLTSAHKHVCFSGLSPLWCSAAYPNVKTRPEEPRSTGVGVHLWVASSPQNFDVLVTLNRTPLSPRGAKSLLEVVPPAFWIPTESQRRSVIG